MVSKRDDSIREKKRLIEAAGKVVKNEIKSIIQCKAYFPTSEETSIKKALNFIPESVHMFFQVLFPTKNAIKKITLLGQAIIQATRPRVVLCPLQLGLSAASSSFFVKILD